LPSLARGKGRGHLFSFNLGHLRSSIFRKTFARLLIRPINEVQYLILRLFIGQLYQADPLPFPFAHGKLSQRG